MKLPPRIDVAIAAVVTVAMVMPTFVPHRQPWWVVVLAVLSSAPLVWRRRFLITSGLVTGGAVTVLALVHHGLAHELPVLMPYGPLICTYTFADLAPAAWRAIGGVVLAAGVIVSLVLPHENVDTYGYVITSYVAAYALGVGTRARRAQREAVDERARRLAEERATAVAEERTRIARDMHDIVTHSVGLMVVQAEAGPLVVRSDPARAEAAFEAIADTGREAIGQLRQILGTLRGTGGREARPGLGAASDLVDRARQAGLDVSVEERGERRAVPASVDIAAYRIIQECLTNTLRHAAARTVRVLLVWSSRSLTVEVADDGRGAPGLREGHGIVGMRERVGACGGTLDIDPRGFTVTATLPIG
ncbi:sensor histidine kinase [Actinomadura sp. DC4]|uniref:sensor histidine kinase n=1 Tax=Actinomadura sp. DC4 TaxID=3055069 RepID=UPI0025AF1ACA|nr:sensor histidine kinase [Actinomadura sp. DC4]MDN3352933.1 sensor histidine kinase [Actinomadura sp. DC4]